MPGSRSLLAPEEAAVLAVLPSFPTRDRLYVVLGLNTGLRLRELTSLTTGQLWDGALPRAFLRIERAQLKLGRSPTRRRSVSSRTLPLNPAARAAIAEHFGARGVAGRATTTRPLSRMQVTRILRRIYVKAGIDVSSRLGSHSLRKRFCAKIWAASGHDIEVTRASLGHRHLTTTQAYLPSGEARAHALMLGLGPSADLAPEGSGMANVQVRP
ncbi:MAG: site-specific tyrosine recombinase XerC [Lentisphaerae bacterium ADurb.BinA184]|nr:MAG: site-specific tyrosine recombinase XerC [Lentisphaerae bacterium ADurb.BinA184]